MAERPIERDLRKTLNAIRASARSLDRAIIVGETAYIANAGDHWLDLEQDIHVLIHSARAQIAGTARRPPVLDYL